MGVGYYPIFTAVLMHLSGANGLPFFNYRLFVYNVRVFIRLFRSGNVPPAGYKNKAIAVLAVDRLLIFNRNVPL